MAQKYLILAVILLCVVNFGCTSGVDNTFKQPGTQSAPDPSPNQQPVGIWRLTPVAQDLNLPVAIDFSPDGRLFYGEFLSGNIFTLNSADWSQPPVPWCQIPVGAGYETGLLGIAVDPQFAQNHFVYFFFTDPNFQNQVTRMTEVNGICAPPTKLITLPSYGMHNGGSLHVGPDGKLYITVGDAGVAADAQDLSNLAGKILRINTDGTIPNDNPFVNTQGARAEIWAYGMRNSFNFTFHPITGDLWATENGTTHDDEVNHIIAGANYGWPLVMGIGGQTGFQDPLATYSPSISPTGIAALGNQHPYGADSDGSLIFADYNNGELHQLILDPNDADHLLSQSVIVSQETGSLVGMSVGPDGKVYVTGEGSVLYRLDR